jgi:hypothetical protein
MELAKLISRAEIAKEWGVAEGTVAASGLPFIRVGKRRLMYRVSDVNEWLQSRVEPSNPAYGHTGVRAARAAAPTAAAPSTPAPPLPNRTPADP